MTVADGFVVALVGLRPTPSRRNDKTVKPRVQHNPAGIHLNPAGRCPNNRGQLFDPETAMRDLEIPPTLSRHLGHMDCGIYAEVITDGEIGVGDAVAVEEPKLV
ncbi:hypothetical protein ACVI1J_004990 [Bradyrhizobium diazoefficiens]